MKGGKEGGRKGGRETRGQVFNSFLYHKIFGLS